MADGENNISDIVQNLPAAAQRPADKPAGTVVSANGERITLGEQGRATRVIASPKQGMNLTEK